MHNVCAYTSEKRETAGSLTALGLTNQKSKSNDNSKSRFPAGMTKRKATASAAKVVAKACLHQAGWGEGEDWCAARVDAAV